MSGTLLSIAGAKTIRQQHGYRGLLVVGIREDGTIDVVTEAQSKADCKILGEYGQKQFGDHLPFTPFSTWFGWGFNGVPTKPRINDFRSLSPLSQEYVAANTHPDAQPHPDDIA